jgi:hypothetical protein
MERDRKSSQETSESKEFFGGIDHEWIDDIHIYCIDGTEYRKENPEFTMGGHHYYPKDSEIPEEVIIIDERMSDADKGATAIQEFGERFFCKHFDMPFEHAYRIMTEVNKLILRRWPNKSKTMKDMVEEARGNKYQ